MPLDPFLERALTRRAFLGRGLAAAGGLAVAGGVLADAAWAGDTGSAPDPETYFPLVLSSDLYASGQPQRLVVRAVAQHQEGHQVRERTGGDRAVQGPRGLVDAGHAERPTTGSGSRRVGGCTWPDRRSTRPGCGRSRPAPRASGCRSRSR